MPCVHPAYLLCTQVRKNQKPRPPLERTVSMDGVDTVWTQVGLGRPCKVPPGRLQGKVAGAVVQGA